MGAENAEVQEVPEWEESMYTPAVFLRVGNKEFRPYRTWKHVQGKLETGDTRGQCSPAPPVVLIRI